MFSKTQKRLADLRHRQLARSQDELLRRFLFDKEFVQKMMMRPHHASLGKWLPEGVRSILELGCGPGKYVAMMSTQGFRVTGVDPHRFPTWDVLEKFTTARLMDGVFGEVLPFPDASFDAVVCLSALLYFKDPDKGLREMFRVLTPGGVVIIRTVNRSNLYTQCTGKKLDPSSNNLYTMGELRQLVERTGFSIRRCFTYGFWPPVWTDLWWYMVCVWIPTFVQDTLSALLPAGCRVNLHLVANRPEIAVSRVR